MNDKRTPAPANVAYVEDLHADWCRDPASVSTDWRAYFERAARNGGAWSRAEQGIQRVVPLFNPRRHARDTGPHSPRIEQLLRAFRVRGHLGANVNPLGDTPALPDELHYSAHGFSEGDLDRAFFCEIIAEQSPRPLREIIDQLRATYCRYIGVQYMHIDDFKVRRWLQERMEPMANRRHVARETQLRILTKLTDAVIFEEFVRRKFLGAKTFSLEGCESLVPLLDLAIEKAGGQGVREIVIGMAHRGRLNVLANILGKSARQIFHEFVDDEPEKYMGGGDVKYHLGYSNDWESADGNKVHLSLCFNPSHLEYINPVALGRVRAKQDRVGDTTRDECMGLLIHGDAAFAGEGIVPETINLSQLDGYATGGTLHVVINNQIGFTTGPGEARSSRYCTEVARMLQTPVFHVNGENPEAVAQCLEVAMDFRQQFRRDVFIDMYGYRRLGHNESDEPAFTQPLLYRAIRARKSVRDGYLDHLLKLKGINREEADEIADRRRAYLESELNEAKDESYQPPDETKRGVWVRNKFYGGPEATVKSPETGVPRAKLKRLIDALTSPPKNFKPHPKLAKIQEHWVTMGTGEAPITWAAAETLALGSVATEGFRVRLSGEDCQRGTFSHRHAVLHDYETGRTWCPLQHLTEDQAPVDIINSPLSEAGVMGFDYGYSLDCPDGLILWEAQFGDFVNAAQVIIDQFISSGEDKWNRLSGLVLLLPHGFEGMGPEHASARIERCLQLCAEDNIQVAQPTTPAQYFHLLRRQVVRPWRKPLVIFTPKSLLRHHECVSSINELARGRFHHVLGDDRQIKTPRRLLLSSGKVHYELAHFREEQQIEDVALLRLEQYYPWRDERLAKILAKYPAKTELVWVQDEPENMGAWRWLRPHLERVIGDRRLKVASRVESASPATGSAAAHKLEQQQLLEDAFDLSNT